jgi:ADP-ribosylglycohydrolase
LPCLGISLDCEFNSYSSLGIFKFTVKRHLWSTVWFTVSSGPLLAVYAVLRASSFQEAVTIAANHDGDSDSTASIAGQLYGAWHGVSALPASWIDKLDIKELMIKLAESFIERHILATK